MNDKAIRKLLHILSDGSFHSGVTLGQAIQMTRAGIWKQLQTLREMGVEIESVKGRGYRLSTPVELFNSDAITKHMSDRLKDYVSIFTLITTNSTNDEINQRTFPDTAYRVCVADHQYAGRGQRGSIWESPLGYNCYYSFLWKTEQGLASCEGLSLVAGLALVKTLEAQGVQNIRLKWPNDIFWCYRKLAGILIEIQGDMNGSCQATIGIGLNLLLNKNIQKRINQPTVDLFTILNQQISKNFLVAKITENLLHYMQLFSQHGFTFFQEKWNSYDIYKSSAVHLNTAVSDYSGVSMGVDQKGNLLIDTADGVKSFSSGKLLPASPKSKLSLS